MSTQTLLTFEEFEQLPEYQGKQELLRGELSELPSADPYHHGITEAVFFGLHAALAAAHAAGRASELGKAHHEFGYKLPDGSYVIPDVSITHSGQASDKYLLGAPAIGHRSDLPQQPCGRRGE